MKENTFSGQTSEQTYTEKGKVSFPDGFEYKIMDIKGKLDFLGTGMADSLTVSGKTKGEKLVGGKMVFKGSVELNDLKAEQVTIKGACKIAAIESKTVEIIFSNASVVEDLQADNIMLKPVPDEERERNLDFIKGILQNSWFKEIIKFVNMDKVEDSLLQNNGECFMQMKSIKGENIYLENVKAALVEGKNIILGPNCIIEQTINI